MEYIKKIRKAIGHEPLIICACGCLIYNEKGQLLLQRRADNNLWGNIGGIMELGETIYETVIREVKEETNLDLELENLKIFNIYSGQDQHHIYPNKDEVYFVNIIFETNQYTGELKKDFESTELRFFDINNLPSNVTPTFISIMKDLKVK